MRSAAFEMADLDARIAEKRPVKVAVEQARRRGVPEVASLSCGAYQTSQNLLEETLTVARELR